MPDAHQRKSCLKDASIARLLYLFWGRWPSKGLAMKHRRFLHVTFLIGFWVCQTSPLLWAESGVLVIHVEDVRGRPVGGMQIGTKGDGGSKTTGGDGKARIPLAKGTKEKSWVSLQIR